MIYLLCSTIRPDEFHKTHQEWMSKISNRKNVKTKVIVDTQQDLLKLEMHGYDVMLYPYENCGITKPLYKLTSSLANDKLNDDDIIIVMSDDFFPPKNWDCTLHEIFSDFTGGINVYDGQRKDIFDKIIPIPILDYRTLKALNYITYHPAYTHFHSDNELCDVLIEMNLLKIIAASPETTFEHRHWSYGKRKIDDFDKKFHADKSSKTLYNNRKKLSLADKLKYDKLPQKLLSILICTINGREKQLKILMDKLKKQYTDDVEILICKDNCERHIGEKRNELVSNAIGQYVCFIDDDDDVSDDYINEILRVAKYGKDCIGIEGIMTTNGRSAKNFKHSIKYKQWAVTSDGEYVRYPNHLNPIKRSIVNQVMFNPKMSNGEDKDFSDRIRDKLKNEVYINHPIYFYNYTTETKNYHKK